MSPILARLDAGDRALFDALLLAREARWSSRLWWLALTHMGGARATILLVLVPLFFATGEWHAAAVVGAWTLALSHVAVQLAKRVATRPRPVARGERDWRIAFPDEFSFPSGHACAAMSVAVAYSIAFPRAAWFSLGFAALVGLSRVRLGVHYPGDVIAGQLLALGTGALVIACL
jgi:undecaprenyl-diphosphatase